jgi:hypothetical protein
VVEFKDGFIAGQSLEIALVDERTLALLRGEKG